MLNDYEFKTKLYDALRIMGSVYLAEEYRDKWSTKNPTIGYSYEICEAVHSILKELGYNTNLYRLKENGGVSWFLKTEEGTVLDYARTPESNKNYDEGTKIMFYDTELSSCGRELIKLLYSLSGKLFEEKS